MSDPDRSHLDLQQLAVASQVEPELVQRLTDAGMLTPIEPGRYRPSDIQRVRAVTAALSLDIDLDQLVEAFRGGHFHLRPMDLLYPAPARVAARTWREVAVAESVDEATATAVVTALGLPRPGPDDPAREDDARLVGELLRAARLMGDVELGRRLARSFGEAGRRTAASSLTIFQETMGRDREQVGSMSADEVLDVNRIAADLMALSEELIAAAYRRHLEHVLLESWAVGAEDALDHLGIRRSTTADPSIAFVDLAGFTGLTETAGDETAARLAAGLADLAENAVARHRGSVVKLLGDGVMLHFRDAADAVRGTSELVAAIPSAGLPPARGGVHTGPLVSRDGDHFGRTVNLAARICAAAAPHQTLVSAEVAALVRAPDVRFETAGQATFKGLDRPVDLLRVLVGPAALP